jgi:hypothetical protein
MDPKEYISSGKLEEYVLGLGTAESMQEVECMARVFPEIKEELLALQTSLEKNIMEAQVAPPPHLKKRILDAIDDESRPVVPSSPTPSPVNSSNQSLKWLPLLLGILLLGLIILNLLTYRKNQQISTELDNFKSEQLELNRTVEDLNRMLETRNHELRLLRDPGMAAITLTGTPLSPGSLAKVYWGKTNQEVYLEVHQLPAPPSGKQYQLWGIVQGKPVDLGIFDIPAPSDSALIKMKDIQGATLFAVTLEPAGGNPGPTLDQMFVAGEVR